MARVHIVDGRPRLGPYDLVNDDHQHVEVL